MPSVTFFLLISLCGANKPATTAPAQARAPATRPADEFVNRVFSLGEAAAYAAELKTAAEIYSLDSYHESARQVRQAAEQRAAREVRDADERAATLAQARTDLTRTNLYRHPHRKGMVWSNHYQRLRDINRDRQQDEETAARRALAGRQESRKLDRQVATVERAIRNLAQVPVHAKFGQTKSLLAAFSLGVAAMPSALAVLDSAEADLRDQAAGDLLEAFRQATLALDKADPGVAVLVLARQDAALRLAMDSAYSRGLAVCVSEAWQKAKEGTRLSARETEAADYWQKASARP